MTTRLVYPTQARLYAGASSTVAVRYCPNNAYDVDPNVGSTSTVGFAEFSTLYGYYRVVSFKYVFELANQDTIPINCYVSVTNTDPGTTGASNVYYASNPLGKQVLLAAKGGQDRARLAGSLSVARVAGAPIESDDDWGALVTSSPANIIFLGLGLRAIDGSNLTSGVSFSLKLEIIIRFYEPKKLTS